MKLFLIALITFPLLSAAQKVDSTKINQHELQDQFKEYSKIANDLNKALYTPGVDKRKDSIIFSDEYKKLVKNESYRDSVFQKPYSFEQVLQALANLELQKASWYLINLYPEHKQMVVKILYTYSKLFEIDKIVIFSVYTYGFFDPLIAHLVENKPQVYRPDLLEEKLQIAKEIAASINYLKSISKDNKQKTE